MNFRQLDYILAVHEQGHFGKAAETCFVSQATLSTMVRKLEDELDITIFDRSRSPVLLTDQGVEVLKAAREIIDNMEQLKQLKSVLKGQLSGTLRLGVIPTVAPLLLPSVIKIFMSEYPDVKLEVKEATTDQLLSDLETNQLDGAVLATPVSHTDMYEYPLYTEALKVYGITDIDKKSISINELKKSKIWLLEEGHCLSKQVASLCSLNDKSYHFGSLEMRSNSFATLTGLVDEFGGYTLLPELYVNIMSKRRQDKTRPIEMPEPIRQISMIVHRPFVKKQKIDAMIEVIRREFQH
ncbi:MAG: LysR substrate-binding domain-containing protein [Saprospiraceae bacterium]|nr:LysR substrate-binding domain-containing protein [Saprospiraceae bacterium]